AQLRTAEGRTEAAETAIERALAEARDQMSRVRLLPAYVEVMLSVGRGAEARTAVQELQELTRDSDSTLLAALTLQADGSVWLSEGEADAAVESLRRALAAWQELEAPYEAALVRLLLAAACAQLEDHERAELECQAARQVFEELGAEPALARLAQVTTTDGSPRPVTDRELEVLRLVAAGHTNQAIAEALVISTKTVERHLSNIFAKLGVSNRAAATSYAYDHGLI
ncbi:MAG: response regulator transcription factor, partial [Actinomycetota bacterium]